MTGLCRECPKRDLCSNLCPEAELYVKQDEKSQRELTIGIPKFGKWPEPREKSIFTKREWQVFGGLLMGKTRGEIAKELGITRKNLREIIRNLRNKRQKENPSVETID